MSKKRNEKKQLIFLSILTMLFIVFAYVQIKGTIFSSSIWDKKPETIKQKQINTQEIIVNDTDNDGLLDFDEKYTYNTSIYLTDTDSDGVSDKDEIDTGTDPLDSASFLGVSKYQKTENKDKTIVDVLPEKEDSIILDNTNKTDKETINKQTRELLIESLGINKDVVEMFDDKTLINLYNETKQETGIDLENINQAKPFNQGDLEITDLSIQELRQILITQGVDEQMLDKLDDNTLREMFLQVIKQGQ